MKRIIRLLGGDKITEKRSQIGRFRRRAFLNNWIISLAAGAVLIFGWGLGNQFLIRLLPDYPAMVPATALTILLSGLGSVASIRKPKSRLPVVCSLLIFVTVVAEYLTRYSGLTHPVDEEMSVASASAAMLFALSLLAHRIRTGRLRFAGSAIDTLGLSLMCIPLLGYIFDSEALWKTNFYTTIALHTAAFYFLLFASSLVFRLRQNWVRILLSDEPGSRMSRRILPIVIFGPVVFCSIALYASRKEFFTADFRLTILAFTMIATGTLGVILAARQINRLERNVLTYERELLQRKLAAARSERIAVLGQLVGGVAHDFNNILSIIIGNLELLEEDTNEDARKVYTSQATTAAFSAAALTRQLLAYGRKSHLNPEPVRVDDVVDEALDLFSRVSEPGIRIRKGFGAVDYRSNLDLANFQQCLLNILINARDAMPDGGQITINTGIVSRGAEQDAANVAHDAIGAGEYVVVKVRDTGVGMSPDLLRRAVDPYFTTKGVGEGSGLGLSMAQGFCRQSGGDLEITSTEGKGTTVVMLFPVLDKMEKAGILQQQAPAKVPVTPLRIMIVEDEEGVSRVMSEQLKLAGYDIVVARDAHEALDLLHAGPLPGLVLSDVIMPGDMQGHQLAVLVRQLFPEVKVLLMSGYQSDRLREQYTITGEIEFLQKPISRATLLKAVSDAIGTDA